MQFARKPASGTEALNLARMVRPDAITLDVLMPKPDGWDVLTALKADAQLRDIPGLEKKFTHDSAFISGCPVSAPDPVFEIKAYS